MYRSNCAVALLGLIGVLFACNARSAQNSAADPQPAKPATSPVGNAPQVDAIQAAQTVQPSGQERVEQRRSEQDQSLKFSAAEAPSSSADLKQQPEQGKVKGFDFYRDPLNAPRPQITFEEIMQADVAAKNDVMAAQRALLESRYILEPRTDPAVTMSRGKPVPIGPTAKLANDRTWDQLGTMAAAEMREANAFPYPPLPHPKHVTGGQVFPQMQIKMFPRLQRFDVDFDLPEAFLPEFPPAIFLSNRPELGDVSRGEVVSINNYYRLFKDLLTPVQLDGLRLLLTPFPQEEFNPTDDRKSEQPSLGVTCFDCHVNGHTTGQFHLNPDTRPQERRMRLDTTSLRGVSQQQIHGSKRSLRSVEDFTEFEQRTAYFNGDPIHAMKKGFMILDRVQVSHMAQLQNMLDFPPAPKLDVNGRLKKSEAIESEARGEALFFGKAQCHTVIPLRSISIINCMICISSVSQRSHRAVRSRPSHYAVSRTRRRTWSTAVASPSKTRSSSSTSCWS